MQLLDFAGERLGGGGRGYGRGHGDDDERMYVDGEDVFYYLTLYNQDYPMLQFIFLVGGVAVVIANLLADITIFYLDPRVKIT